MGWTICGTKYVDPKTLRKGSNREEVGEWKHTEDK